MCTLGAAERLACLSPSCAPWAPQSAPVLVDRLGRVGEAHAARRGGDEA